MSNIEKVEPTKNTKVEKEASTLTFHARKDFGKKSAHKLRKEGKTPCTVTSNEVGALHYSLDSKQVERLTKHANFFANVISVSAEVAGKKKSLQILPSKIDFHPVNEEILHVDFLHVTSKEVEVKVPVKIVGADKAPGLKKGGKLNLVRYHLPLKAEIKSVPEVIEINIASFGIGKSLFLSNLILPKGVKPAYDCLVLSITGRGKKEKDEVTTEGATGAKEAPAKQEPKKETK